MENGNRFEEEKRPNIVQQAGYAGATLAAAGAVDMLAHLGPTGLVVGGILAYAAYRHGPELADGVRSHLPQHTSVTRDQVPERPHASRSILDRALGRFPAEPEPANPAPGLSETTMHLAPNFTPDVERLVGKGIVCYGIKGSGKTNTGALLAEQFGQFYIPLVVFDKEGDYTSLVEVLPQGFIAGAASAAGIAQGKRYLAADLDVAGELGAMILKCGYQVVFDLRTYADDTIRAQVMIDVVEGLMKQAEATPNAERVPCLVFTDEASHWFPQDRSMSYVPGALQTMLLRTFIEMSNTGRKRGIIPAWFDQRPANFDKRLAAESDIYVYMRQRQDVDLRRYREAIGPDLAEAARTFSDGEGVVVLPKGRPFVTTFFERRSQHVSHTPRAAAAIKRFGNQGTMAGTGGTSALVRRREEHRRTRLALGTSGTSSHEVFPASPTPEEAVPSTVPKTEGERKRFTIEQETEFIRRFKACGSIREAIAQMHVSYGRYQHHASQIVRERKLRRAS